MADVLFVFPLTQDSAEVPDSFVLETDAAWLIMAADDSVVKSYALATNLHLVDTAETDPTVIQLGDSLSLVNHGGLTRDDINTILLDFVTRSGLVNDGDAGGSKSETGGDAGSIITSALSDTALITGYTAP